VSPVRLWQPETFLPHGRVMSFGEAAEELRGLAVGVIGAWSRSLGPAAVAASGGVDSSLICAALARGGAGFSCITLATADPSGDERSFVRLLAEHLGVRSIAALYDPGRIDPLRTASAGLARPSRKPFLAALDSTLLEAADNLGANVIFDGNGGDNLFCFLHSAAPVADRLRCEGPGRGSWATFLDMCHVTGCDLATMARAVLTSLMRQRRRDPWPADTRLLAPEPDGQADPDPLAPWLESAVGGKRDHLALIMRAQNHLHGLGPSGLPRFSPLMSQPLLEFCLGVPTWLWCARGINRAPARSAFACDLPPEIVRRTSKAGPDSFIRRSFSDNRSTIRAMLLDGLLARQGLLDLAAVEQALGAGAMAGGSIIYRLLDLAEAEAWARSWQG
jgi:asparagine synthase (glutamine-hydrolysing)